MDTTIAIVGGGPGGLSAAIRAAELGLEVVLYEKGGIGQGIKCAEGFIDTLGALGRPEAGVLFRVEKTIFFAGKDYRVHLQEDCGLWMIDRSTWQQELAKKARRMGVSIVENCPIDTDRLTKMIDTHKHIIDASGAPSVTSRMYGFVQQYVRSAALLLQYVIEGDFGSLGKNTIRVGYEPHYVGYYWIFPKGQNIANVGVGRFKRLKRDRSPHLRPELDRILKKEGLDGYRITKRVSSFCPSNCVDKLVWQNILLVGDAAALSSPLHGGGIDMACISGRLAAEAIAHGQVYLYPMRLWQTVGKKLTMEKRVCSLWHRFGYPFIVSVLKCPGLPAGIVFNKQPFPQILGFGGREMFQIR
jgi:digeranylgeranylglycerophospholipid reductase